MIVDKVFHAINKAGGRAYYVGGTVRDRLLGIPNNDFDVEVFELSPATLYRILDKFGDVHEVGQSFGVLKLESLPDYDFSLPRRESKSGAKHTDFDIEVVPDMTLREAAKRRDYTINSMALNVITGEFVDPFGGAEDLKQRLLRPTSDKFTEDPLRVLRGFQFCGRFGLIATDDTIQYARSLSSEYSSLSQERIWGEWWKWATKSTSPSSGLRFLHKSGWLSHTPYLPPMIGTEQDPIHHPEGDAWNHTLHVVDAMCEICSQKNISGVNKAILMFSALLHDIGKPDTTNMQGGRITSYGHDGHGAILTKDFFDVIGGNDGTASSTRDIVVPLVREHMFNARTKLTEKSVRRLANRLEPANINQLVLLIEADQLGRPPNPKTNPGVPLLALAEKLHIRDSGPEPIVMGRHLIERGLTPGKHFGTILDDLFQKQLDGVFEDIMTARPYIEEKVNVYS